MVCGGDIAAGGPSVGSSAVRSRGHWPKRSDGLSLGKSRHIASWSENGCVAVWRGAVSSKGRIAAASFRSALVVILMLRTEPATIAGRWPIASTS